MQSAKLLIVVVVIANLSSIALAAAPAEKKLDYKQEQSLKDATFYLDQAEGVAEALAEKVKDWKAGDTSIQLGTIQNFTASKDKAVQQVGNATKRLDQLPKDHSKVKPEIERAAKVKESLAASEKKLNEVGGAVGAVVAQGEGAGYKADFDRLKDINLMFGNPQILESQPDVAIEIVKQIPAVKDERKRIADKYADLLKQRTNHSDDMNATLKYFDEVFGKFDTAANDYAANAPAEIDKNIDEALKMSDEAVKEHKHLYFGEDGGVRQRLSWAQTRYNVLAAIKPDDPATAAAKKKIEDARAKVKEMQGSLNEAIIEANAAPKEQYNGPDKSQLNDLVKAKWASNGVQGDVLKMGINSKNWQRSTRWEYANKAWSKVDKSFVQGFVVVKADDKVAHIYYVNLVKDHMADDKITAHNFDDPKADRDVNGKVLIKNVK